MADIFSAAGAKLYIGPAVTSDTDTQGEYEALSFTEVALVEDLGEFGDSSNPITFTALNDARVQKKKGSKDAGTISATLGRDSSDAGQAAIVAAEASPNDYAFKIELNDASEGSPSSNTVFYFRGQVMSYTTNIGSVDNIIRSTVNIGINSEIIPVDRV